ncbi:MAG: protein kinase [Anaerolineae bacterium]|nr:protein kinase [Anaerolineae bacterium]MBT7074835.1 protein kinase [Anaerolineae bacterium]MBT7782051.1 protein kinase [Anaerolineae bacterium]
MAFDTGENVGSYRVMEKLGRGGMATVYKAYHANLDRYVALKVLHPAFLEDPNFLARFQREARLVAKLEHTNIVPVYDFAEHDEQPYLVMKYIEGDTLKAHLNKGRLETDEIWKVVEAVGAGLGYAHQQGILHRDIKPSNVIMAKDGKAYLADFGLARIAQSGESTLSSDMIMGTPQYISPEQAKGEKNLDNGTDIYSFAVMLYEMVVGQVPFSSDTPFSIIHDHIYSPLPLPHLVNPKVPDEVERVLLKALSKEREDRYESVEALNAAFKKAWDDSDIDMADATMTSPIQNIPMPPSPDILERVSASTIIPEQKEEADIAKKTKISEKTKKKRKIWPFAAAGLLVLLAIFFIINAAGQDRVFENLSEAGEEGAGQLEENAPIPVPIGQEAPERVEEARQWVNDSPDDPYAHIELALMLLEEQPENREGIQNEVREIERTAGDNIEIYEVAGYEFASRGYWRGATLMFLRAVEISGQEDIYMLDNLRESAYKFAGSPLSRNESGLLDRITIIDPTLTLIAQARHEFYYGDRKAAQEILEEAKRQNAKYPEIPLLRAEILLQQGHFDEARGILEAIWDFPEVPDWIAVEVDKALSELP